jgi:hypothetical protein
MNNTLGGRGLHIYVTRAAAIAYQTLTRTQFETARRTLTERLIRATPHPRFDGWYLFDGEYAGKIMAYAQQEGNLLMIPKIKQADDDGP